MIYWVNKTMDPYVTAGVVITMVIALGIGLAVKLYRSRTHTPSVNVEGVLNSIIPKMK